MTEQIKHYSKPQSTYRHLTRLTLLCQVVCQLPEMLQTSPECRRCRPRCFTGSRAGWSLSRRPVGRVDIGGRRSAIRSAWPAPSAEDVARIGRDVRQRSRFLRRLCRLLPSRLRPAVAARAAPGVRGRSDVRVVLLSYVAHLSESW